MAKEKATKERYDSIESAILSIGKPAISLGDRCLLSHEADEYQNTKRVDLRQVPDGTLLAFRGTHRAATYWLHVLKDHDVERVLLWNEPHATPLVCRIEDIISYYKEGDAAILERGVLQMNARFIVPYFIYHREALFNSAMECTGSIATVLMPTEEHGDSYSSICMLKR